MADVNWSVSNDREDDAAWIENEHGVECVEIKLDARNALTEGEFEAIVDLIAAAPEMLSLLREYRQEARACGWGCDSLDAKAAALIAKAEPPRREKRRVRVEVEVEVMVERGESLDAGLVAARVQDHAFMGMHDCYGDDLKVRATLKDVG
jgi:hypothetical protein